MDPGLSKLTSRLEDEHWWFTARAEILASVCCRLVSSPARVVEVGSGTGNILGRLPADWDRVGVDPSAEAVAIATSRFPDLRSTVGTAPGDVLTDLSAADLVLLCDVLEHIERDADTLEAVLREVPASTKVLITVPAWMDLWSSHDEDHGHFRRYDRALLESLWKNLPVRTVLVSALNWRLYPLVRLFRSGRLGTLRGRGWGGSDLFLPPRPVNAALRRVFLSERGPLLAALEGSRPPVLRRGVSWIAVLEKR